MKIGPIKITFWRVVFALIMVFGGYAMIHRLFWGLGASTNLTDTWPWGIWVGFNMYTGVALSAGGFTVAAVVNIFHLEKYRPIVRSSILLAFLGYMQVGATLMIEIGLPWRIWHPTIMYNPHSVMFEVAWCVMLYLTVLSLEFVPVVLERFNMHKAAHIVHAFSIPVVIAGIILSTLHQSSLGSMFLIVPQKLYPLWYSPLLPVLYFVSAVCVGLGMVIFESGITSRGYGRRFDMSILTGIGRALLVMLWIFGVLRIYDLYHQHVMSYLFMPRIETYMFWLEFVIQVVAPIALLSFARFRENARWLFGTAILVVLGLVLNRSNVAITGLARYNGAPYFPSWEEVAITLLLIAVPAFVFAVAAKYLPIFPTAENPAMEPNPPRRAEAVTA